MNEMKLLFISINGSFHFILVFVKLLCSMMILLITFIAHSLYAYLNRKLINQKNKSSKKCDDTSVCDVTYVSNEPVKQSNGDDCSSSLPADATNFDENEPELFLFNESFDVNLLKLKRRKSLNSTCSLYNNSMELIKNLNKLYNNLNEEMNSTRTIAMDDEFDNDEEEEVQSMIYLNSTSKLSRPSLIDGDLMLGSMESYDDDNEFIDDYVESSCRHNSDAADTTMDLFRTDDDLITSASLAKLISSPSATQLLNADDVYLSLLSSSSCAYSSSSSSSSSASSISSPVVTNTKTTISSSSSSSSSYVFRLSPNPHNRSRRFLSKTMSNLPKLTQQANNRLVDLTLQLTNSKKTKIFRSKLERLNQTRKFYLRRRGGRFVNVKAASTTTTTVTRPVASTQNTGRIYRPSFKVEKLLNDSRGMKKYLIDYDVLMCPAKQPATDQSYLSSTSLVQQQKSAQKPIAASPILFDKQNDQPVEYMPYSNRCSSGYLSDC